MILVDTLKSTSIDAIFDAEAHALRTTVNLDDALLLKAQKMTGIEERSALLREALKALIEREAARRLARLGGSQPDVKLVPRRRPA